MEEQIRQILQAIGEDPNREGLLRTPQRVAQALTFLTRGYDMDPAKVINEALFTEEYEEMIVQKDIDFYSLCEHHLLPFFGKAHVAYIPHHKIVGISKLARLVDIYARRLQVQERMTNQIATIIMEKLDALLMPKGICHVGVNTRPRVNVGGIIDRHISNLYGRWANRGR